MKDKIKLSILWIFSFIVIIFMMSFSSHAEETINPLPYYVNYYYSDYFHLTSTQLDLITSYTAQSDYNIFWLGEVSESNTNYTFNLYCYQVGQTGSVALKNGSDLTLDVPYNLFDMDTDYVVLSQPGGSMVKKIIRINKQSGEWSFLSTTMPTVRSASLLHLSTKEINQFGFTPFVPFIFQGSQPLIWQGDPNQIIFGNGQPIPPTPEDENITDETEKPTFSDYEVDWSTGRPSFDPDDPGQSLFSFFSWFASKIGDTLEGGWNFIVDSLDWALQRFLNNVRSKFNEIKEAVNDFADLVDDSIESVNGFLSDIKDKIDYISEPVDSAVIYDNISQTSLVTNIGTIQTSLSSFQASFTGVEEPSSYSIPIHLENLPSNWFGTQTTQYIDLGVINGTVKDGLRLFVWAMVTYSLVVTIFDSISNYINGGGDES